MLNNGPGDKPPILLPASLGITSVTIQVGTVLADRYRIEENLGEGGMGRVYRAWDIEHSRNVAIKQLILQMDSDNSEIVERFRREYYFLNSIDHPNLVKAYDFFNWEGQVFLALEFVIGISLKNLIQERPFSLSLPEQVAVANQVARAVEVLNTAGILHRDIKPGNIVLDCETGRVSLLDLGLGKAVGKEEWALTQKGAVLGTLEYLSPEQASGSMSAQSDVFSLGTTLYQFFLWQPVSPFKSHGGVATIMEITTRDLPPLLERMQNGYGERNLALSKAEKEACADISGILSRALEKEPENRPSAGEIADELERIHERLKDPKAQVSPESTNWELSRRVGVEQMEQLQKLGEKYGRDRVPSRRRRVKRVSRAPAKSPGQVIQLCALLMALVLFLSIAAVWWYLSAASQKRQLAQKSRELREMASEKDALASRLRFVEEKWEEEYGEMLKLHEAIVTSSEFKIWGDMYGKCADFYQKIQRYEQSVVTYKKAISHTPDSSQKTKYYKEIEKLEKKIASVPK